MSNSERAAGRGRPLCIPRMLVLTWRFRYGPYPPDCDPVVSFVVVTSLVFLVAPQFRRYDRRPPYPVYRPTRQAMRNAGLGQATWRRWRGPSKSRALAHELSYVKLQPLGGDALRLAPPP